MPNRFQLVFLGSFVGVFSALVFLFNYGKAKLRAAGYDISELILIGLPKDENDPPTTYSTSSWLTSSKSDMFAQLLALILAVCTSAVVYWKFGSSESTFSVYIRFVDDHDVSERKPVLDSTKWQEFSLKEKIIVSPNTAMSVQSAIYHPCHGIDVLTATGSPCLILMTCWAFPSASICLYRQRLTARISCEAIPPRAVTTTLVISTFSSRYAVHWFSFLSFT